MSTARVNTLANLAGTGSPDIVGGELSRARFNLNGTGTIAARDSFNVSSFVDNGTGNYTANFSVAAPDTNYSVSGCHGDPAFVTSSGPIYPRTWVVSSITIVTYSSASAVIDVGSLNVDTFGDKP